ncbi:MAG: hypothetical protein FWC84_03565 [Alphaproteobacteria bacterium]|nr:hypothetical protein [Alphaproteobacteria bacterium]
MGRFGRDILAAVLFAISASTCADAKGYTCSFIKLPRGNVALHAGPSASSAVIARLEGAQFIVLDDPDETTEWIHVAVGGDGKEGVKGWVKGTRAHSKNCG